LFWKKNCCFWFFSKELNLSKFSCFLLFLVIKCIFLNENSLINMPKSFLSLNLCIYKAKMVKKMKIHFSTRSKIVRLIWQCVDLCSIAYVTMIDDWIYFFIPYLFIWRSIIWKNTNSKRTTESTTLQQQQQQQQ